MKDYKSKSLLCYKFKFYENSKNKYFEKSMIDFKTSYSCLKKIRNFIFCQKITSYISNFKRKNLFHYNKYFFFLFYRNS